MGPQKLLGGSENCHIHYLFLDIGKIPTYTSIGYTGVLWAQSWDHFYFIVSFFLLRNDKV